MHFLHAITVNSELYFNKVKDAQKATYIFLLTDIVQDVNANLKFTFQHFFFVTDKVKISATTLVQEVITQNLKFTFQRFLFKIK